MSEITESELRLLRTYAGGPKIWDVAELMPAIWRLQDQGLIEPASPADDGSPPSRGVRQLTAKGRQVLAEADAEATSS
jgi:DNA-binding PadR family transcriptional regulator